MFFNGGTDKCLKAGRYVYDVEILSNDSPPIVTRVIEGQIDITPRVTRG